MNTMKKAVSVAMGFFGVLTEEEVQRRQQVMTEKMAKRLIDVAQQKPAPQVNGITLHTEFVHKLSGSYRGVWVVVEGEKFKFTNLSFESQLKFYRHFSKDILAYKAMALQKERERVLRHQLEREEGQHARDLYQQKVEALSPAERRRCERRYAVVRAFMTNDGDTHPLLPDTGTVTICPAPTLKEDENGVRSFVFHKEHTVYRRSNSVSITTKSVHLEGDSLRTVHECDRNVLFVKNAGGSKRELMRMPMIGLLEAEDFYQRYKEIITSIRLRKTAQRRCDIAYRRKQKLEREQKVAQEKRRVDICNRIKSGEVFA